MQWYKRKAINYSNDGLFFFWQKSTVQNQIIFPKLFDLLFLDSWFQEELGSTNCLDFFLLQGRR